MQEVCLWDNKRWYSSKQVPSKCYTDLMVLKNKSTNQVVSNNLKIADSFTDRCLGLLNKNKGTALLFTTRFGIHTFFMKYPLLVLVLDIQLKVVSMKKKLKPNSFFFWNPIYSKIVELPPGKLKVSIGDELAIESGSSGIRTHDQEIKSLLLYH